jgi:hypothetical protein
MTALPSFVELMASLGLDQDNGKPDSADSSRSSPSASPRISSNTFVPSHSRSKSNISLRESHIARQRMNRFSPYSPSISASRRGSLSSLSSSSCSSDTERVPLRDISSSPRVAKSALLSRRSTNSLSIHVYRSACDFQANTPISSFVRRKTPSLSPTSPTFSDSHRSLRDAMPSPLIIPTLPNLYPSSANSESFPITPTDPEPAMDTNESPRTAVASKLRRPHRFGIRISSPSTLDDADARYPRRGSISRHA